MGVAVGAGVLVGVGVCVGVGVTVGVAVGVAVLVGVAVGVAVGVGVIVLVGVVVGVATRRTITGVALDSVVAVYVGSGVHVGSGVQVGATVTEGSAAGVHAVTVTKARVVAAITSAAILAIGLVLSLVIGKSVPSVWLVRLKLLPTCCRRVCVRQSQELLCPACHSAEVSRRGHFVLPSMGSSRSGNL